MHTPSPTSVTSEFSKQSNQLTWRIDPIGFTRSAVATVDGLAVNIDVKPDPLGWMRYGIQKLGQFSKVPLHGAIRHFPLTNDLLDDSTWLIPATPYDDLVLLLQSDGASRADAQQQASDLINREYEDAAHYGRRWNYVTVTVRLSIDDCLFEPVHMNGLRSDDDKAYFDLVAKELIENALSHAKSCVTSLTQRYQQTVSS